MPRFRFRQICFLTLFVAITTNAAIAQSLPSRVAKFVQRQRNRPRKQKAIAPPPTHENVQYGKWKRNVFDIWIPESDEPTPMIVFIHGGGFVGGNKNQVRSQKIVQQSLDKGIAFAAIHYRFRHGDWAKDYQVDGEKAAIQNILRDSARALQYVRAHAADYNLNGKIACYGGSAGAGTSIWLAFHDDLANPNSEDPVLRESSRISAAGMLNGQFTYDVEQWDQEFKDINGDMVKTHADGRAGIHGRFMGLDKAEYTSEVGLKWRKDVDMRGLITPDDPPVYALTSTPDRPPTTRGIYNHHPRHAQLIDDRCKEQGVQCLCLLPKVRKEDATRLEQNPDLMFEFFCKHLGIQ